MRRQRRPRAAVPDANVERAVNLAQEHYASQDYFPRIFIQRSAALDNPHATMQIDRETMA
jgi:hypothetical protein